MSKVNDITRKQKGDQFEEDVADLYMVMGYEVSRHVPMFGQEVDILAKRRVQGGGPYTVIVECKYKGGNSLAGNEDVQSIAPAYSIAKANNAVSSCTLVTTNGFSLAAKEAAKASGIHLTTKRELVSNLLDFSHYMTQLQKRYINDFGSGEESWYIQSRVKKGEEVFESLDDYVDRWLSRRNKSPLAILGGYGTGKSSFCRHYASRLSSHSSGITPVIIPLRDFPKVVRLESLIRDFLDEQCDSPSPKFDTFWRMYQEGLLLIFFDGFDEMATRVDRATLEANLTEIEKFAGGVNNMILTCRPEFFVSGKEEAVAFQPASSFMSERASAYERIDLMLWTDEQVSRYVDKRVESLSPKPKYSPEYYSNAIHRIPSLADLSVRAVHLELIIKMLPTLIDSGKPITRPSLYRAYLEKELSRESVQNKRLKIISDEDRLALLRTVAAEHFFKSQDVLDFEVASRIIQAQLGIARADVESVTRDFLNRSFLLREGDAYRFAHKSIGEYLFAQVIYEQIIGGNMELLSRYKLISSSTVAGIVLDFFGGLMGFESVIAALKLSGDASHYNKDDTQKIYFAAGCLVEHIDILIATQKIYVENREVSLDPRYLGDYVHALRTPITPILGWSHILLVRSDRVSLSQQDIERGHEVIYVQFKALLKVWGEFKEFILHGRPQPGSEIAGRLEKLMRESEL